MMPKKFCNEGIFSEDIRCSLKLSEKIKSKFKSSIQSFKLLESVSSFISFSNLSKSSWLDISKDCCLF